MGSKRLKKATVKPPPLKWMPWASRVEPKGHLFRLQNVSSSKISNIIMVHLLERNCWVFLRSLYYGMTYPPVSFNLIHSSRSTSSSSTWQDYVQPIPLATAVSYAKARSQSSKPKLLGFFSRETYEPWLWSLQRASENDNAGPFRQNPSSWKFTLPRIA